MDMTSTPWTEAQIAAVAAITTSLDERDEAGQAETNDAGERGMTVHNVATGQSAFQTETELINHVFS